MTVNEILDAASRVMQAYGWTFLRLGAAPALFCVAALAFFTRSVFPGLTTTVNAESVLTQVGEASVALALGVFVALPLFLIGVCLIHATTIQIVSDHMNGSAPRPDLIEADRVRLGARLLKLAFVDLLLSLSGVIVATALILLGGILGHVSPETGSLGAILTTIGLFGLLVGVLIWVYVRVAHSLAGPIAILEGIPSRQACRRSRRLMANAGIHGAGSTLATNLNLIVGLLALMIFGGYLAFDGLLGVKVALREATSGLPLQGLLLDAYDFLPAYLMIWTLSPFWAAATTIHYYDRRVRLEGYDIEALALDALRSDKQARFQL